MGMGREGVRIEDKDEHSECYHVGVPSMGWTMYSQFQPLELGTLKLKFHHHWKKKNQLSYSCWLSKAIPYPVRDMCLTSFDSHSRFSFCPIL